jgi:hypothetical protein
MGIPGMRRELMDTVEHPKEGIRYALTELAMRSHSKQIAEYASKSICWAYGDLFKDALVAQDPDLGGLIPFMRKHKDRLCCVGPKHIEKLPDDIKCAVHLEIGLDCWEQKEDVKVKLMKLREYMDVVLLMGSFLSVCVIYDLHEAFEGKWMLDVGSGLDLMCGVKSRSYTRGKRK